MKHLWILLALVICTPAYAADESVQKVIGCMRANVPPTLQVQAIELLSTDRAGSTRTLKGKIYVMREKSSTTPYWLSLPEPGVRPPAPIVV